MPKWVVAGAQCDAKVGVAQCEVEIAGVAQCAAVNDGVAQCAEVAKVGVAQCAPKAGKDVWW